ncbi:MAG: hypothetical protein IKP68_04540 [Clostridia bacterium]|nr:hypothetical protein [Clostridia bacterium]
MKALSQEKKKQILFICVVVLLVLVVFGFTIGACFLADKSKSEESEANMSALLSEGTDKAMSGDVLDFESVSMSSEEAVPSSEEVHSVTVELSKPLFLAGGTGGNTVSYTINATVLPATAKNKNVTWTAAWGDSSNTSAVSTYLTVTPAAAGSTTATITCLKPFTGNIIVTCTTQESGFEAACVVQFKGVPSSITLTGDLTADSNGKFNVIPGKNYAMQINLANVYNQIGSEYSDYTYSLTGVGQFKVGYCEHYNTSGKDVWYDNSYKTVNVDDLKDQFVTVTQSGNSITITTIKSFESYYKTKTRMDGGRTWGYDDKFKEFVTDCYFKLAVRENTSGLVKEYIINFDPTLVAGISLTPMTITF